MTTKTPKFRSGVIRPLLLATCLSGLIAAPLEAKAGAVAFWTFEGDGTNTSADGTFVAYTAGRTVWPPTGGILVRDVSGNGNHLFTWDNNSTGHQYRQNVPAPVVPQTGDTNHFSIQNNGGSPATFTWSTNSHPVVDVETIEPLQWTIEASIYQTTQTGNRTFVGRDGNGETNVTGVASERAPLYFCATNGILQISFTDAAGNGYDLQDPSGAMSLNQWYNVAAISDGTTLSLYKDSGFGYVLVNSMSLTGSDTRLNYDSDGSSTVGDHQWSWTIGRGRASTSDIQGGAGDGHTYRFFGYIDNVRISDSALSPQEFLGYSTNVYLLSGPTPSSQTVAEGLSASFSINVGGEAPIYFQWRHDGAEITGANSSTFTIPATTLADSGNYDVIVTNSYSALTSSVAVLTVHQPIVLTWAGVDGAWNTTSNNWTTNNGTSFTAYVETDHVRFDPLGVTQSDVTLNAAHAPSSVVVSNASYVFTGASISNVLAPVSLQDNAALTLQAANFVGAVSIPSGSKLTVNANQSFGALSGAGLLSSTNGARVVTFGADNVDGAWDGSITNEGGTISFIKVGTGTNTFTAPNYLAGTASQVNGGGLILSSTGSLVPAGAAEFWVAQGSNTAYVEINGGSMTVSNWLVIGRADPIANGTMVINSGSVTKAGGGNLVVGSLGATGTLIINGGSVSNNANLWLGENLNANATLHLNGGLLQATQIRVNGTGIATSYAYFNGGTLQAMAASADFIPATTTPLIQSGGLVFDNNGFDVTINNLMTEDPSSTGGGLIKKGAGTLTITGYNYTGPTVVREGTLAIDPATGIFFTSPDLVVSNAALSISAGGTSFSAANVTIENGAVMNLNYGIVAANPTAAAIAASGSLSAPGAAITINISAFGLQVGTIPLISYAGSTLGSIANFVLGPLPPGVTANLENNANSLDLVITATGQNLTWYGDANNTWDINGAANWQNSGVPGATYQEYGSTGDPVTLDDSAVGNYDVDLTVSVHPFKVIVNAGNNYSITGAGGITGPTSIVKSNAGTLLLGTANSHTGGTFVYGGTLAASNNAALGAASVPVTLVGGNLQILNNALIATRSVVVSNASTISVPAGHTATIAGDIRGTAAVSKTDDGTLNVTGTNSITSAFNISQGTVNFSGTNNTTGASPAFMNVGSTNTFGTLNLLPGALMRRFETKLGNANGGKGTLNMTNATLITGGGEVWIGGSLNDITCEGEFNVVNSSVIVSNWTAIGRSFRTAGSPASKGVLNIIGGTWTNVGGQNFAICSAPTNLGIVNVSGGGVLALGLPGVNQHQLWVSEQGNGILNINNGSVFAFRAGAPAIAIGRAGNSAGSIRLNSGLLYSADQTLLGHGTGTVGSYGELNQSGGTFISRFYIVVGANNDRSIFRQTGGDAFITNRFMTIGAGGTGSVGLADLAGGTFTSLGGDDLVNDGGRTSGIYVGENGTGILNVRNSATVNLNGTNNVGGLRIGNAAATYGIVNLNGGVLTAQRVAKGAAAGRAFLSFNGGTLKANASNANFLNGLNEATIHAGGATIDDSGFNIAIGQPLIAPTGNGVASIAVVDGGSNYVGAPLVFISGGTGTNCTAVANMVSDGSVNGTLKVDRIAVTGPGSYTVDPTTVTFVGGGQLAGHATAGAITMAANVSGGLTKIGNGTLALNGTNTYTGRTLVSSGTLAGTGVIAGAVTNNAVIAPGNSGIGTLTINGDLTMSSASTNVFEVNGSTATNDVIAVGADVNYAGALNIVPTGSFTAGQQFVLFRGAGAASVSNFASVQNTAGDSLTFSFANGVLTVLTGRPSGPATLTNSYSGGVLSLSWPAGQGWRLQMQTNSLSTGLSTNWAYVTDSTVSSTNVTLETTKPTTFFRLVYP